ncbi:MAG: YHS domain-containing protein [Candidatus Hydrothermarchaeales archaeon]
MATDPVCNMGVDEATAEHKAEYEGETYYFCAPGCKTAFEEDPEKYLKGEKEEMREAPEKKWWQFWK